jgi:protein-tyrosine-phosphatase
MTFTPVISSKSHALAAQVEPLHQRALRLAREREERLQQARATQFTESIITSQRAVTAAGARKRVDTFMSWEEQRKTKLAELKKARDSEEMSACLFKPSTNPPNTNNKEKFEDRLKEDQRKRQERIANLAVSLQAKETEECTHKPVTNFSRKIEPSVPKVLKIQHKRKSLPIANPLSIDEIFSLAREN